MAQEFNVKGLSELNTFLQQLPVKLEKNVLRGAMRAGIKVIQTEAKSNIHSVSGELAKGLKITTNTRGGKVTATLKATGPHAHVARWLEYGTKAHFIKAKAGKALSFGGHLLIKVLHPGMRPKPFMRPALDSRAQDAVVAAGEYTKKRLATKEGLDTADIQIGDEP